MLLWQFWKTCETQGQTTRDKLQTNAVAVDVFETSRKV